MNTNASSTRRLALFAAAAAVVVMGLLTLGATIAKTNGAGATVPVSTLAGHAGMPLAPGDSGGEVTRGNQSGSFAPTSTNDLITPWSPTPGSPWRD